MLQVLPFPPPDPMRSAASDHTRRRKRTHTIRPVLAAAVAVATALLGTAAADAVAASGPTTLAYTPVDRMVQSTGNLYWTSHYRDEFNPPTAVLYRASKLNTPGSERVLYAETGTGSFHFGDLTYANAGDFYAYFVANYPEAGVSQIKRVPLAGGTAVPMVTSPAYIGMRDIDTDGTYLYWADAGGVRRMPIGGGAVTTLDARAHVSVLGLDATRVIYGSGAELRSIPKTGGQSRLHHISTSKFTALDVVEGSNGVLYWGHENGVVRSGQLKSNGMTISPMYQGSAGGRSVRSVAFDGTRVLWTDCAFPAGNGCAVRKYDGGTTRAVSFGTVGAENVVGDATAMFWSDTLPKRYGH